MTLGEALRRGARRLGGETPLIDARVLLQAATGLSRTDLVARDRDPIDPVHRDLFDRFVARRAAGEPVSQIVRAREFWGRVFKVTPDVLTPRPETEMLVEAALGALPRRGYVLDAGTGSGCILLSLLAERPSALGVGTDLSAAALRVAHRNATAIGVTDRARLIQSDWFENVQGQYDLIVSNPPYISEAEMADLAPEVARHDPAVALTPGGDGLDAYRAILFGAPAYLRHNGRLVLEIGWTQGPAVAALAQKAGYTNVEVRPDLGGRDRVVTAICDRTP